MNATRIVLSTLAAAMSAGNANAATTDFPVRPLRMIVPYAPGGNADIMARLVGQRLGENVGQQVVIDNRAGASGIIGTELAVKAPPDGYSIVLVASSLATNPSLIKTLPYDTNRDLAPITMVGSTPLILAAYPGLAASNAKELVALAKAQPGQLNYASSGVGSPANLAGTLFNFMTGINIVHVTYKGTAQATTDVLGGRVQMFYPSMTAALPYVKSGKLKALGTGGAKRTAVLPDVPAIAEDLPGYETNNWWGILAPAATQPAIVKKLNVEINRVMQLPETQKRFASEGADPVSGTPEDFSRLITTEMVKWAKVAKTANIKAD